MSPWLLYLRTFAPGFPRVSGDEPLDALLRANPSAFSPRERG